MQPRRILLILATILAASGSRILAAGFDLERHEVGAGTIRAVRVRDMNGDGRVEIVAFADGPDGAAVHVFPNAGVGGKRLVLRLAEADLKDVYFAFLAKLRPDAGADLIVVDKRRGVVAFSLAAPEAEGPAEWRLTPARRLAGAPAIPFAPDAGRIHVLDAAADLDGDGIEELILPAPSGYEILRLRRPDAHDDESGQPRTVETRIALELSTPGHHFFTLTWVIPRLTVADWDGDGIEDLVGGRRGEFLVFLQRRDGTFYKASRPLEVLDDEADDSVRNEFRLGDVDGDSRTDLVLTRSPTSIRLFEKFTSRQYLFLNPHILSSGSPGKLAGPVSAIRTEGISVNPMLTDFDGDGDLDLVVTSLGLDMKSRIRKRVTAVYLLYHFDSESRSFEREPRFRINRPFPVDQLERNSTAPVCFFTGDFNGDGDRDLLDIADDGHITMLAGTRNPGFLSSDKYGFKDAIFRTGLVTGNDVRIIDLNGDGQSDVVSYRGGELHVIRSSR